MYQLRTITVRERVPPKRAIKDEHAYDKEHYARQSSRFWNIFQLWTQNKWAVEPDEENSGRWIVWNSETEEEIAVGNSAFQALESAIKRTKK